MYSWQGVRGILESLEGDIARETDAPETTPARSTRSRRSRGSGRSGGSRRQGWSTSPGIGEWSVDSIDEEEEEEESGEEIDGRRRPRPHRRTDTDHTVRPAFPRDIAIREREQLLERATPLSTSPEAEPSTILSPQDPARLFAPPSKPADHKGKHVRTVRPSVRPFRHFKADLHLAADTRSIALSRTLDRTARTITDDTLWRAYAALDRAPKVSASLHG